MAEATDRPQSAVTPKTEISAMPAMSEPYRPLSLLALAGFGVAVLYAFIVVVGGLIALFSRLPWLMPTWTFLIPIAALVLCWAARTRIRDSEGTLSGLAFTTWGFRLTVVVGLTYAASYFAIFLAVRHKAILCADQFFAEIEKGQPDKAFLLAVGGAFKGVEEDELRDRIENLYNTPGPNGEGAYSRFRHGPLVRSIEMADGEARITPTGVTEWEYKGGYRVVLRYHIDTPLGEFDANVETFGRDNKPGEPRGSQWQVDLQKGQTGVIPSSLKLTPRGEELRQAAQMAWNFVTSWQDKINRQEWDEVWLGMQPPEKREQLRKEKLAGWQKLANANPGLIRRDEKRFWTGKAQRDDILKYVDGTFRDGGHKFSLRLLQTEAPLTRASDGRVTTRFDSQLTYVDAKGEKPKYVLEGQLVVSAAEDEGKRLPSVWRVESFEPESGRTPPERPSPGGPGGPGGPAGR